MIDHADCEVGKIIKRTRTLTPLTLCELGKMTGVSSSHLGRIERGEILPSAHVLRRSAKPLGFSENELFMMAGFLSEPFKEGPEVSYAECQYKKLDPIVV